MYLIFYFNASFWLSLYSIDEQVAKTFQLLRCPYCSNNLNWANYPRKVRGVPEKWEYLFIFRFSLCCCADGCRKRVTPPSVRFLGQKVYAAVFVIIVSSLGKTNLTLSLIKLSPSFSTVTLKRWSLWWNLAVHNSSVWKSIQGALPVNTKNSFLPTFLIKQFTQKNKNEFEAMKLLLKFISPISEPSKYPSFEQIIS